MNDRDKTKVHRMVMKVRPRTRVNSKEKWTFMKPKLKILDEGKFKMEG